MLPLKNGKYRLRKPRNGLIGIIFHILVTLYGTTFNSSGLKMRGNLRSKNAELIEKVRTSYEIQNKQTQP
ncbi:hypothetical protein EIMP300_19530 [Escherichia coli]|uniref:Uncharacterized protein n=1 Tax=Escherichia coli TaxID=562 RepID=A0A8S0FJZ9_ECOLX|nr:hypothetical protein EIMP300_19530 [Escherichia coli]